MNCGILDTINSTNTAFLGFGKSREQADLDNHKNYGAKNDQRVKVIK